MRADEHVVGLRQLDGLVHDREVAVVHMRSAERFTMMREYKENSRRVEAIRYVSEVYRLHESFVVALQTRSK